ncbi:glycerophosphodiester phosphodiesterase [Dyella sp.]|uniref:glycerophosphodiester phosphodiesterase n=1 Tax=Dyella sp. TaxID=1869338 RepID=UPI002D799513|nr:glycerophosphodiester phosphodiesterase [Dyella sp.]HET6431567.1 glycerophosphodiester phosphodiesterase [Dyella sp.]
MTSTLHAAATPLAATVRVIGHRGASALRPEHTLAAYAKAIADGADVIEPDLVMTRDGVMVARHENEIGSTTDVASHREFAAREVTRVIDGQRITGWFTEDFTLAELKTLRARERLPELRGTAYDGQFQIVTLEEIIDFVAAESAARGRVIGLIPEIKHGSWFRHLGLPMEDALLATLATHAYTRTAPVEIQSFEIGNLKYLRDRHSGARTDGAHSNVTRSNIAHSNITLLQLIDEPAMHPGDVLAAGGSLTYAQMTTPAGLAAIARYADAIGPDFRAIIPYTADGHLGTATPLVRDAHAVGLEVHPYTFRPENAYLAKEFWQGTDPRAFNEAGLVAQIRLYLDTGIDAFFTDHPAAGRRALAGR